MQRINFSIHINAPKEKVWKTMLEDKTYREWTSVFSEGSQFSGSWEKGSKILFVAPDQNGKMSGMVSRIEENKPYEFLSIVHLGEIKDGVENMRRNDVSQWAGAYENYTFKDEGGGTKLIIDMDTEENYKDMFDRLWPKALEKLKTLSET